MIDRIVRGYVPVWINIRTTPVPDVPGLNALLSDVNLDADRLVTRLLQRNFMVRSAALRLDGTALTTSRAVVKGSDYLALLNEAGR